ncbi:MAG: hypothetical protein R3E01_09365 [Pirellulaceae bacterium]
MTYRRGEWVVYTKQKFSASPGPRAKQVSAASRGDTYSYLVDKYWVVAKCLEDDRVLLRTRTGKEHVVAADDTHLRRARWWERLLFARRYRSVELDD